MGQPEIQALLFAGAHSGACYCTDSNVWYSEKAVKLGLCTAVFFETYEKYKLFV